MPRFIVVVLDGFGVGEMPDVPVVRPQDIGANTASKLINYFPNDSLPTLESLGLVNITETKVPSMEVNKLANVGKMMLAHEGGDTFMGHQEIMGTKPKSPLIKPFKESIDLIEHALLTSGLSVERIHKNELELLVVNKCVTVGDNLEADLGQVYNITGNLNEITFESLLDIGKIVRSNNCVARNIVFGGNLSSSSQLLDAIETKGSTYIGVSAPKSGVYDHGFQVMHLGYGVDTSKQVPAQLHQVGVKTTLIGKVADIVGNESGTNYMQMVDTTKIMDKAAAEIKENSDGFFCINIQETDLSGHQEDPQRYWKTLKKADRGLNMLTSLLDVKDTLVVIADHGNDPFIGHSRHTREFVPLMVYKPQLTNVNLGIRNTLSDVGATVCEFFGAKQPENGHSFLHLIL
ncbi:hypothetical protein VHA01S_031_00430 [Vibrio halioticoli NBRC 102217]|uniref:Metalloenzyme domain-containing protein n=1 Tax=Vibrio halioticoli NBRC 102217 TaxID=1219072 RepID=V5FJW0_9VIBR|nr:phosphopentomutase [Vibrio halioticoli]GAD90031.1 hypothetical protein VHA01S_031_00430 [Vibrio halioticoli NBRC 102217]